MKREIGSATHTDLNREFEGQMRGAWKYFFAALIGFTLISLLSLRSWG
jgi:hypothetical protein